MRNFLRYDGPLGRFLNSVADMVLLNLLWLLCSLPVVTIGASTVALYTVTLRYPEDDSGLAGQMTGYPAGEDEIFADSFREQMEEWFGTETKRAPDLPGSGSGVDPGL